nr:hypothetical protein [Acidimicrobiia bacterium]
MRPGRHRRRRRSIPPTCRSRPGRSPPRPPPRPLHRPRLPSRLLPGRPSPPPWSSSPATTCG